MPRGLVIKQPKDLSTFGQLVAGILIFGPLLGLWFLWRSHRPLHFENPWVNLAAHAALIVIPLLWAVAITSMRVDFQPTEEIILGRTTFLENWPADWWHILMLWPAAIVGLFAIGMICVNEVLSHPQALSTSLFKAIGIMAVTFCLGVFYGTILFGNAEPRTLISHAGLRTGMSSFFEWENIHHFSRQGDLYSIYHRANPHLPATSFKVHTPEARATLDRFISEHQVQVLSSADSSFAVIKLGVILGFLSDLFFALWLRFNSSLSALWIVVISFLLGTLLTLLLERIRGVSKFTKYKPKIEPASENAPPAILISQSVPVKPPPLGETEPPPHPPER